MSRKVLVVGDSLSMSRAADGIMTTDTFAAKLQLENHSLFVVNASGRGLDTSKINIDSFFEEHIESLKPDVVILALGIVDSTPRIFTEFENKILLYLSKFKLFKYLVSRFISFCSKYRFSITKYRNISYISSDRFYKNIFNFVGKVKDVNPECEFVFINILSTSQNFASRNFGFYQKVKAYNSIIQSVCSQVSGSLIDLYSFTDMNDKAVLDDGYHITALTHDYIFNELKILVFKEIGCD